MPQPQEVIDASEEYLAMLQRSEARIMAELEAITDRLKQGRKIGRLNELLTAVRSEIRVIVDGTETWLLTTVPAIYERGAIDSGLIRDSLVWNQVHRAAAQAIIDFQYEAVLAATDFMEEDAKRWFRDMARAQNERGALDGLTAQQQARAIRRLAPRAVAPDGTPLRLGAVVYSNGSTHGIVEYSNMLARTTTALTYNEGTANTMLEEGVEWVEVFDGADCGATEHDDPDKVNGTVRPARFMKDHPIAHPNCRRSFGARFDVTSADEASAASPSISPERLADQALFEREGAAAADAALATSGRQPRTGRTGRTARVGA